MLFIQVLLSSLVIGSIVRSNIQITQPELFFRAGSRRISIAYDLPGILLEVCLVRSAWLPYGYCSYEAENVYLDPYWTFHYQLY